jgi:hypothetical protein
VELHQFRIEAGDGEAGLPTPEGAHRDGVDWVIVMLIDRVNVASGVTDIFANDGAAWGPSPWSSRATRSFSTTIA